MIRHINSSFKVLRHFPLVLFISIIVLNCNTWSQVKNQVALERDSILTVALEIIRTARFCALVTLDKTGQPQVRTMDPFTPDENMIIWFGTNSESRKVEQIRNDPRVSIYYSDSKGAGYVTITGIANIVNDEQMKLKWWKEEWINFYGNEKNNYTLIKVMPVKLDIISYKYGITGDPDNWRSPSIEFEINE